MAAILFPSAPSSASVRIDTGTSARSSSPSVRTPREVSQRRSAPATTVSTTSLTVPPSSFFARLKSASVDLTQRMRRCGPISTFSGSSGAGFRFAHATSPSPSAASRTSCRARLGDWTAPIPRRRAPSGALTKSRTPSATSSAVDGSGCGVHGSGSMWRGTGSTLNRTLARSRPEIPSTIE